MEIAMIPILLLGAFVSIGSVEKGDDIVRAQLELLKISYFCDDPLYRTKRSDAVKTISRLQGVTSFSHTIVEDLDTALKNKKVKMNKPINRGDCIVLIAEAKDAVDRLINQK
jgi:hypothetical protein